MNETMLLDNRVKIIKIREVDCELENLKEIVDETLKNPNKKYEPLVEGFKSIIKDAQSSLKFITKLIENEMKEGSNMSFNVKVNYNTSNHTKDA